MPPTNQRDFQPTMTLVVVRELNGHTHSFEVKTSQQLYDAVNKALKCTNIRLLKNGKDLPNDSEDILKYHKDFLTDGAITAVHGSSVSMNAGGRCCKRRRRKCRSRSYIEVLGVEDDRDDDALIVFGGRKQKRRGSKSPRRKASVTPRRRGLSKKKKSRSRR